VSVGQPTWNEQEPRRADTPLDIRESCLTLAGVSIVAGFVNCQEELYSSSGARPADLIRHSARRQTLTFLRNGAPGRVDRTAADSAAAGSSEANLPRRRPSHRPVQVRSVHGTPIEPISPSPSARSAAFQVLPDQTPRRPFETDDEESEKEKKPCRNGLATSCRGQRRGEEHHRAGGQGSRLPFVKATWLSCPMPTWAWVPPSDRSSRPRGDHPSAVGVDIGCGMIAAETDLTASDLPEDMARFLNFIERVVPAGVGRVMPSPPRDSGQADDRGAHLHGASALSGKQTTKVTTSSGPSALATISSRCASMSATGSGWCSTPGAGYRQPVGHQHIEGPRA